MKKATSIMRLALWGSILTVLSPGVGLATTIGFCDADGPGFCSKSVTLTGNILAITLTNTSPVLNGGYITADAFNLEGAASVTAFATTNANFSLFSGGALPSTGGSFNVAPDGTREFVISVSSPGHAQPYTGGGSPTGGIAVGSSATFTLTLGGNFSSVTEANVFSSELVRFKGFVDGRSDKDRTTGSVVPEPASVLLLGSGLIGVGLWGRRRALANRQ